MEDNLMLLRDDQIDVLKSVGVEFDKITPIRISEFVSTNLVEVKKQHDNEDPHDVYSRIIWLLANEVIRLKKFEPKTVQA